MPPRSSTMNAVVAMAGSSASARAASARVAAATSSTRRGIVDRYEDVNSLGAAGLHRSRQTAVRQGLTDQMRDRDDGGEVVVGGWIEVEHHMGGPVDVVGKAERRVILDRALVAEPQQSSAVIAQRVVHLPLRRLGPYRHRLHPVRGVFRHVLLHERLLVAQHPEHGERSTGKPGKHPVRDRVEIVHQVALGGTGVRAQRLVEVGELDPGALFVGRSPSRHPIPTQ